MNKQTNNFLLIIAVIAVGIALVNLSVTIMKVGDIRELTGFATEAGTANLTIESYAAVNFTTDNIDWGSGTVDTEGGKDKAYLDTKTGTVTDGNWTANSAGLVLENIGNINVTLDVKAGKSAASFIGGTSPNYTWMFNELESGSCTDVSYVLNESGWVDTGSVLPGNLGDFQVAVIGSYVYLFGGYGGSATNVIYKAAKKGIKTDGLTMVMPWIPCIACANAVISAGIKELIVHKEMIDRTREKWIEELTNATELLQEADVNIIAYEGVVGTKAYMHGHEWRA